MDPNPDPSPSDESLSCTCELRDRSRVVSRQEASRAPVEQVVGVVLRLELAQGRQMLGSTDVHVKVLACTVAAASDSARNGPASIASSVVSFSAMCSPAHQVSLRCPL